ncbi:MAG: RNA polymerase sigma factor [Thermoanaerobaculia bacterium]
MTASLTLAAVPERTALDRARDGDTDAFAQIVEEHEAMVFSIAYHFFGDRSMGEEIAQDVFLQLFRRLHDIESGAHLLFWLRKVATRRCIDEMRRKRPRGVSLDAAVEVGTTVPNADPLLDRQLRRLVAELPEAQRVVITLRYQEDLDPSEICDIVGMPVNTVKSHLHRGIAALRKKLGDAS